MGQGIRSQMTVIFAKFALIINVSDIVSIVGNTAYYPQIQYCKIIFRIECSQCR
jgi:hypothetical protein